MEHTMSSSDDPFGGDPEAEAAMDEFDRHSQALHELIQDYFDAEHIPDAAGATLLLSVALNMRMVGYALEVEKPSGSGLKLDLDRFRRDIDDAVRHAKKGADEYIEKIKPVLAAERMRSDDDDEEGEEP